MKKKSQKSKQSKATKMKDTVACLDLSAFVCVTLTRFLVNKNGKKKRLGGHSFIAFKTRKQSLTLRIVVNDTVSFCHFVCVNFFNPFLTFPVGF